MTSPRYAPHLSRPPSVPFRRPSVLAADIVKRDSMRLQADLLNLKVPNKYLAAILGWL